MKKILLFAMLTFVLASGLQAAEKTCKLDSKGNVTCKKAQADKTCPIEQCKKIVSQLKRLRGVAAKENATKTVAALDKMIANAQKCQASQEKCCLGLDKACCDAKKKAGTCPKAKGCKKACAKDCKKPCCAKACPKDCKKPCCAKACSKDKACTKKCNKG